MSMEHRDDSFCLVIPLDCQDTLFCVDPTVISCLIIIDGLSAGFI